MIINLEEVEKENQKEEPEEEEREEETPEYPSENQEITHQASDQNQQERQENLNRELDEIFDRNSASREESSEKETASETGEFNTGTSSQNNEASQGTDVLEETSEQAGRLRNSSISYSLRGRNAIHIPNPIYTCDRAGKIVVNIRVDAEGRVLETSINKASSTSTNQCLTEKAMEYAAGARFSKLVSRENQPGTITFLFQP